MRLVVQIVWVQDMGEGWSVICPQREHLVTGTSYNTLGWLECRWFEWNFFPPVQHLECRILMKSTIAFLSPVKTLSVSHEHLLMSVKISSGGLSVFYTPVISVSFWRSLDRLLNSKIGSQWCAMFRRHTAPYVHLLSWFNLIFAGIIRVSHRCLFRFSFSKRNKNICLSSQFKEKKKGRHSKNENGRSDNLCHNSPLSDSLLYRPEEWSCEIFKSVAIMSFLLKVWQDSL